MDLSAEMSLFVHSSVLFDRRRLNKAIGVMSRGLIISDDNSINNFQWCNKIEK